jgi:SAM-dependent methyltransferase
MAVDSPAGAPEGSPRVASAKFWDDAATENAAWYVATGYTEENDAFFAQGAQETDFFLGFCGVAVLGEDVVLEIGAGVGRMTKRLAALGQRVIACDISAEMLSRAKVNLAALSTVDYVVVPGDGTLPVESGSVDVVFSYIVLQHVPAREDQVRYLSEAIRVLAPGGRLAIQVRATGLTTVLHEWAGFAAHLVRGRRTLSRAWRGAKIPNDQILALGTGDVTVELRRHNVRHTWVVATRAATSS